MKLLHLYHDLLNLYGDYANVSALCRILKTNGIEYTVHKKTLGDVLDFSEYDFVFVGSGSEENQKLALSHLKEYKSCLDEYINSGKIALFTGNSFEMLGSSITSFLGEFDGLGIFTFNVTEQNKTRITSDAIFEAEGISKSLVGFTNKCSYVEGVESPLFSVKMGSGNTKDEKTEGVFYKGFYGTHLTGPILVKNPHFLKIIAEQIVSKPLIDDAFGYEKLGFEMTLKKLIERK